MNEEKIVEKFREEKAKIEKNFWHHHYDYIVKRCNDLG